MLKFTAKAVCQGKSESFHQIIMKAIIKLISSGTMRPSTLKASAFLAFGGVFLCFLLSTTDNHNNDNSHTINVNNVIPSVSISFTVSAWQWEDEYNPDLEYNPEQDCLNLEVNKVQIVISLRDQIQDFLDTNWDRGSSVNSNSDVLSHEESDSLNTDPQSGTFNGTFLTATETRKLLLIEQKRVALHEQIRLVEAMEKIVEKKSGNHHDLPNIEKALDLLRRRNPQLSNYSQMNSPGLHSTQADGERTKFGLEQPSDQLRNSLRIFLGQQKRK
jgi:hypothetical protein